MSISFWPGVALRRFLAFGALAPEMLFSLLERRTSPNLPPAADASHRDPHAGPGPEKWLAGQVRSISRPKSGPFRMAE